MECGVRIIRRHHLDTEADLVQNRRAGKPVFGHGPFHDLEEIDSSRGEVGRRDKRDVAGPGSPVDLVRLAIKGYILGVLTAWSLVEIFVPDHDLRATRSGNAVDPDVVGNVINTDMRTRFGKAAG